MSEQKNGMMWAIVMIISVLVMLVVQNVTHWELSWIFPIIGVVVCFIIIFVRKKDA